MENIKIFKKNKFWKFSKLYKTLENFKNFKDYLRTKWLIIIVLKALKVKILWKLLDDLPLWQGASLFFTLYFIFIMTYNSPQDTVQYVNIDKKVFCCTVAKTPQKLNRAHVTKWPISIKWSLQSKKGIECNPLEIAQITNINHKICKKAKKKINIHFWPLGQKVHLWEMCS